MIKKDNHMIMETKTAIAMGMKKVFMLLFSKEVYNDWSSLMCGKCFKEYTYEMAVNVNNIRLLHLIWQKKKTAMNKLMEHILTCEITLPSHVNVVQYLCYYHQVVPRKHDFITAILANKLGVVQLLHELFGGSIPGMTYICSSVLHGMAVTRRLNMFCELIQHYDCMRMMGVACTLAAYGELDCLKLLDMELICDNIVIQQAVRYNQWNVVHYLESCRNSISSAWTTNCCC